MLVSKSIISILGVAYVRVEFQRNYVILFDQYAFGLILLSQIALSWRICKRCFGEGDCLPRRQHVCERKIFQKQKFCKIYLFTKPIYHF